MMKPYRVFFLLGLLCLGYSSYDPPAVKATILPDYRCVDTLCPGCQTFPYGVCVYDIHVYHGCSYSVGNSCEILTTYNCTGLLYPGTCANPGMTDGSCGDQKPTC